MNSYSSNYMDKRISELPKSQPRDFLNFSNSLVEEEEEEEEEEDDDDGEDRSFHFRRTRPRPSRNILDGTHLRNWSSMDLVDSAKVAHEKVGTSFDVSLVSEIDRKMKEHADNLLHAVEGLSARVTQLESRTRQVENAVDELKEFIEYNHERSDGMLRDLEHILKEVQGGIQDLRDKQDIAEAQLQIAKFQVSKGDLRLGKQSSVQTDSEQEALSSAPQQMHQTFPVPVACPPQLPSLTSNVPPNLPHCNHPPIPAATAPQLPTHIPLHNISSVPESYHPPPMLTPETTHQQYHMPSTQWPQPLPPASHQPFQIALQFPPSSQLSHSELPQLHPPFRTVNPQSWSHHPEAPHMPSQSIHQSSQPPGRTPPTQQFYGVSAQLMHDQPSSKPYSEFPSRYSLPSGHPNSTNLYPHGASPSPYSSSTVKSSQLSPSDSVPGGGNSYARLPTARILPHALPTASTVDGGSGSGGSGSRLPVDDVVDNIVAMGFRRDLVRATIKKLTENGQSVDPNVVLDKLMNNGEVQPQNVRFGR